MASKECKKTPLPFHLQFLAGAVAGVSEITVMYPLDVVKTRFQLQTLGGIGNYTSILDCFSRMIKEEGVASLYRGIVAPVLVEAPKRAIKFAANEQYAQLLLNATGKTQMTQPLSVLTGMLSGTTEAFAVVSFELVKVRMQDRANAGRYRSTLDCVLKIAREEGPLAFFRGLEATIWRHAAWNGGYFGVIHYVRGLLQGMSATGGGGGGKLGTDFVAGAVGGTVGTILNTPFDVAKTRIQNCRTSRGGALTVLPKYRHAWSTLCLIAKEEGLSALYKGFLPKVLRLGPGGGILLVVFEMVSSFLKKSQAMAYE